MQFSQPLRRAGVVRRYDSVFEDIQPQAEIFAADLL